MEEEQDVSSMSQQQSSGARISEEEVIIEGEEVMVPMTSMEEENNTLLIPNYEHFPSDDDSVERENSHRDMIDNFKDGIDISSPEDYEHSSGIISKLFFSFLDPLIKVGYKKGGRNDKPFAGIVQLIRKLLIYLKIRKENQEIEDNFEGLQHSDIPKLPKHIQTDNIYPIFEKSFKHVYLKKRRYYSEAGNLWSSNGTLLIRVIEKASIFQKLTRITPSARSKFESGELTNLFSTDTNRLAGVIIELHDLWLTPIMIIVGMTLIILFFGFSAVAGILAMIAFAPVLGVLAKLLTKIETELSKHKDERIKVMSEILNGIRIVKFFVFEDKMKERVYDARAKEYQGLRKGALIRCFQLLTSATTSVVGSGVTFISHYYMGGELTMSNMFTGLVLFETFRTPLFNYPNYLSMAVTAYVSAKRIGNFLFADEITSLPHDPENKSNLFKAEENKDLNDSISSPLVDFAIKFKNATISWGEHSSPILKNINLTLEKGKLYCLIGNTGSGKSSLFSSIYGDTVIVNGSVSVNPYSKLTLSDENPWMINGTVRENIIFDKSLDFDSEKYEKVLDVCQLRSDLAGFQNYDQSEIGYSGINLSLGQKHRIGLARACYSNSDIILMDSSLNSIDARLCKKIFRDCIMDYLKDRTRILITHSLQLLKMADEVIVLQQGEIVAKGPLKDIMDSYDFSKLITEDDNNEKSEESSPEISEEKPKSKTTEKGSESKGKLVLNEERTTGNISWGIFYDYLKEYGISLILLCIFLSFASLGTKLLSQMWISFMNMNTFQMSIANYVWIYLVIGCLDSLILFIRSGFYSYGSLKSSLKLHNKMLEGVLRAPILFFDQNPVGRILNRFTQDINATDNEMLFTIPVAINIILNILLTIILISTITPLFLVVIVPIGLVFYLIQIYYRVSSREIRRLESIARSPSLSHFSSCLQGINTIKALLVHEQIFHDCNRKIDFATKHSHFRFAINRWLGIRIQVLAQIVVFFTALFAIIARHTTTYIAPSLLALSITYSLQLTDNFTFLIRYFVDLESSMTSVERIVHYCNNIDSEAPTEQEDDPSPEEWPSEGRIEATNFSVRYRSDLDPVLKSINFTIDPGTKVGIVGRSGSGKSSLLISLFRFLEADSGNIKIDGYNISDIGLKRLRQSLLIIPQQPVLFTGTIRYNLDIFNEFTDKEIWSALERVHLKNKIRSMEKKLDEPVTENGGNFSIGERQLVSLARCILRKAKIIIFDESTAFVDHQADALVQKIVREEFKHATIITVAHRLDTIIDSDKIIVMEFGEILEVGSPKELLKQEDSNFYKLVKETGKNYSSFLKQQAFKE
ncbi:predicted protein [Naegleria gruberi]|uniref:Predicted protein n=1 Tax=Naegleria gruberi TaxID=5762 RepID=D2VTV5_NAEGR|nr:uncharacterized protein NAEGRDRAFT_52208 [Naegleria gruberi]EFC39720.1 predicted protein [Naegleria gruberi]|eukprot:XP_002672464.1 predicted protein [Naegleria gruberi strain NEG-M]